MLPCTSVILDYYPKIQAMRSQKNTIDELDGKLHEGNSLTNILLSWIGIRCTLP